MSCNQELFQKQEQMLREELYAKDIIDKKFDNVDFWSYTLSNDGKYHVNLKLHRLEVPTDDSLYGTYEKTIAAFKLLNSLNIEYDYILRTNCSTYINVKRLKEFVDSLIDDNKIYSGGIYCSNNGTGPYEWCLYGVGNSLLLSKFWVNVLCNNHVNYYKHLNKVYNENETYYHIDDNTIGLVINCYCLEHGIDMYGIWNNFSMPIINSIPDESHLNLYIAIPFRQYNLDSTRDNEITYARRIHKVIKNSDVTIDPSMHTADQCLHIIDFTRNMHSIVPREFGEHFLDIMSYPRFIKKIKFIKHYGRYRICEE